MMVVIILTGPSTVPTQSRLPINVSVTNDKHTNIHVFTIKMYILP